MRKLTKKFKYEGYMQELINNNFVYYRFNKQSSYVMNWNYLCGL